MYEKPRLERFGTLRELTLVGSGGVTSDLLFGGTAPATNPARS